MKELKLMKGNEALAEAVIRSGCDAYFGYPITPQSEILEYLINEAEQRTGMTVLQAESEIASIYMVYGAAGAGKRAMTSSSSPGISLMQEGISYIACAELPCLIVNVVRGGPGLGTIQPSQGDYYQAVKGGGHGDYKMIVLAPASVQEMVDFTRLGFDLAFKWRNPVMILADGILGQMMEKVELFEQQPRIDKIEPWATVGKPDDRERNFVAPFEMQAVMMEKINLRLQAKYKAIEKEETRFEMIQCDDAEIILTGFGLVTRICQKAAQLAREKGIKVGVFRPKTLFPFPSDVISELASRKNLKGFLNVEMNAGQMLDDIKIAVNGKARIEFLGRMGGVVPTPEEILEVIENEFAGVKL